MSSTKRVTFTGVVTIGDVVVEIEHGGMFAPDFRGLPIEAAVSEATEAADFHAAKVSERVTQAFSHAMLTVAIEEFKGGEDSR